MRRHPRRIATTLTAALACAALAAPVAHADQQPTADASATVTLGATLDGLLGGDAAQAPLQDLLTGLQGGQAPTASALAPLQDVLLHLAATPGLPADVRTLVAQLAGLLGAAPSGQPLDPALLGPVATLLRDLGGTSGVPSDVATLLNQLADLLDGNGTPSALPVDALALPPAVVDRLGDLLRELEQGGEPTGTALEPVSDLLDAVAATPQLPKQLAGLLGATSDSLRRTGGELDPLIADQTRYALRSIAATPGLTPSERTTIERIATFVSSSGGASGSTGTRKATKRDGAVIKRVRVNRARTRVGIRIACPRSAPRTCATKVTAKLSGRKAAHGKRVRIAAGRSKVVRLRLLPAARTASARHGGRLRVRVETAFGSQRFVATKAVRVRARHRR